MIGKSRSKIKRELAVIVEEVNYDRAMNKFNNSFFLYGFKFNLTPKDVLTTILMFRKFLSISEEENVSYSKKILEKFMFAILFSYLEIQTKISIDDFLRELEIDVVTDREIINCQNICKKKMNFDFPEIFQKIEYFAQIFTFDSRLVEKINNSAYLLCLALIVCNHLDYLLFNLKPYSIVLKVLKDYNIQLAQKIEIDQIKDDLMKDLSLIRSSKNIVEKKRRKVFFRFFFCFY